MFAVILANHALLRKFSNLYLWIAEAEQLFPCLCLEFCYEKIPFTKVLSCNSSSICHNVGMSVCLFVCLSVCLYVSWSVCRFVDNKFYGSVMMLLVYLCCHILNFSCDSSSTSHNVSPQQMVYYLYCC